MHCKERKKERAKQTLIQLNCNLFVIWKHSSAVLAGAVAAVFIQWEKRSADSIALNNSGLPCFALSFISLLGPLSVSYRFHKKIFVCTECHLPTSKVTVNNNKQLAAIKCFYHDIWDILRKKKKKLKLFQYLGFYKDFPWTFLRLEKRLTLHWNVSIEISPKWI